MIVTLEEAYGVSFSYQEIGRLNCIGALRQALQAKRATADGGVDETGARPAGAGDLIVWRDVLRRVEAAEELCPTSERLLQLGIVDHVAPEPRAGAHTDHDEAARLLAEALAAHLEPLLLEDTRLLLQRRYVRFRNRDRFE